MIVVWSALQHHKITIFFFSRLDPNDVDIKHIEEFIVKTRRRTQFKSNYIESDCIVCKRHMKNNSSNKCLETRLHLEWAQSLRHKRDNPNTK